MTIIRLTESQFRRFVETVYAEAYSDGATNGAQQSSEELWLLSRSKDYMERLIEIDRDTEAAK